MLKPDLSDYVLIKMKGINSFILMTGPDFRQVFKIIVPYSLRQ